MSGALSELTPLTFEIVGLISPWSHGTYVKRVSKRFTDFLWILRFPSLRKVDWVGWDSGLGQ